jgi:hypothetical protein
MSTFITILALATICGPTLSTGGTPYRDAALEAADGYGPLPFKPIRVQYGRQILLMRNRSIIPCMPELRVWFSFSSKPRYQLATGRS